MGTGVSVAPGPPASEARPPAAPAVSVVVVSDYGGTAARSWDEERTVLDALARQDFAEPFEVVLAEHAAWRQALPPDLVARLPGLRVEWCEAATSAALKDAAVRRARAPVVAVLEVDCVPDADWLRHLVAALRAHPDAAAVSGKTVYGGGGVLRRCLGLLDRSYLDPGDDGPTPWVSNNGAIFPRAVLERFPYPPAPGPFAAADRRRQAMRRAGLRFYYARRAVVRHDLPGWGFVRDMRRHRGFALALQLGPGARPRHVARVLARNVRADWARCRRHRREYGVRWHELPLALALAAVTRLYEWQGVRLARAGARVIPDTRYR
jgi:hypothetical protein